MYQALFGVAIGMADFELDTQSYLPEQGENKSTHGVNADGDADLTQSGSVQGDGFVHVGRETADKQAKALIDPGREDGDIILPDGNLME